MRWKCLGVMICPADGRDYMICPNVPSVERTNTVPTERSLQQI